MAAQKLLLVEGVEDSDFYSACLRVSGLHTVEVKPPKALGENGNGLGNVIPLLPSMLAQLVDGRLDKLGIVIDADYKHNGVGHTAHYKLITGKLAEAGYKIPSPYPAKSIKYVFSHPDSLPDVGVWIMPNNGADGMVENYIANAIADAGQVALFKEAVAAVKRIPKPLFDPKTHCTKAQIRTWLAWQQLPGKGLASTIGDNLIDLKQPVCTDFHKWLTRVFK